jgi:uncharacterized membrane protein
MILIWAKLIHIASVSLWAGGLLALPLLMAGGRQAPAALRPFFIAWLSPAAFAALLSGLVLVTRDDRHHGWFDAKLALVLLMALVHVLVARRVVARAGPAPRMLLKSLAATAAAITLALVWVAVAKPGIAQAGSCADARVLVLMQAEGGDLRPVCRTGP